MGCIARLFLVAALALLGLQAFPAQLTNPPVTAEVEAPPRVAALLERSCYDCHSNETNWPWYAQVAPTSWLLVRDVERAREEVNFSEWGAMSPADLQHAGEEIVEVMEDGEMPLWYYRPLHPRASLNDEDRRRIAEWASEVEQRAGAEAEDEPGAGEAGVDSAGEGGGSGGGEDTVTGTDAGATGGGPAG